MKLDRTRGDMRFMRAHFEGRLRAEIRASDGGSCVVLVRRGDDPIRETRLAMGAEAARDSADSIIHELFPHVCTRAECGDWVEVTRPK